LAVLDVSLNSDYKTTVFVHEYNNYNPKSAPCDILRKTETFSISLEVSKLQRETRVRIPHALLAATPVFGCEIWSKSLAMQCKVQVYKSKTKRP